MSTQDYKVGQALVYTNSNKEEVLAIVKSQTENQFGGIVTTLTDINGNELEFTYWNRRPATENEILTEAKKNGWVEIKNGLHSPLKNICLHKIGIWELSDDFTYKVENGDDIAQYGRECIIADRLITALNLVPKE